MTLRSLLAAALLAASAVVPAGAQTDAGAGTVLVAGRVVDARTGEPLRRAVVRFPAATVNVFTDAQGRFAAPVPPGEHAAGVWLIGYHPREVRWRVAAGDTARLVALEPDSAMGELLRAAETRIDRRARAAGIAPQRWGRDVLAADSSASVAAFLAEKARLPWAECGSLGMRDERGRVGRSLPGPNGRWVPGCVRMASGTFPLCVIVDEELASVDELMQLAPADVFRVEAYGRVGVAAAYTNAFVERLAVRGATLAPMDRQTRNLCQPPR